MKLNLYAIGATIIIAGIATVFYQDTGDQEPAIAAVIFMTSIFGLGWGAGARSSQAEIDRLNVAESARRVRAACDAGAIKRLTADVDRLKERAEVFA